MVRYPSPLGGQPDTKVLKYPYSRLWQHFRIGRFPVVLVDCPGNSHAIGRRPMPANDHLPGFVSDPVFQVAGTNHRGLGIHRFPGLGLFFLFFHGFLTSYNSMHGHFLLIHITQKLSTSFVKNVNFFSAPCIMVFPLLNYYVACYIY